MEAIEIDFDPKRVKYEELLGVFWDSHSPRMKALRRQYASAVFFHDDEQRRVAEASRAEYEAASGKVATELLPFTGFTLAEDYHQKYRLRSVASLDAAYRAFYPELKDYVDSTATMRLNAWLDGEGRPTEAELSDLGLRDEEIRTLKAHVAR